MLHHFIARIGARDVHLVGHVSNEELTAYYELADVFVCASEHEGFCVPLVESFHMGVPVLAYAATAVPVDDGRRRRALYGQGSAARRRADQRHRRRSRARRSASSTGSTPRSIALEAKDFGGTLLRHRRPRARHRRAARIRRSRSISGIRSTQAEELEEIKAYRPSAFQAAAATRTGTGNRRMIVNQWVPAAHKGDAIGDSARRVRGAAARAWGTSPSSTRMTIDDDLRGDVDSVDGSRGATQGDLTIFHFALVSPMTAAFARLPSRARAAVSQRHAGAFLCRLRRRRSSAWRCSGAKI